MHRLLKDILDLDRETIKKNSREDTQIKIINPIIKLISIAPIAGPIVALILIWAAQKFGPMKTIAGFVLIVLGLIIWANQNSGRSYSS